MKRRSQLTTTDSNLANKYDSDPDPDSFASFANIFDEDEAEVATVRAYFGSKAEVPDNWCHLTVPEKVKILEDFTRTYIPNIPDSLVVNTVGSLIPGDSRNLPTDVPSWLDKEKFERGQRFARDNIAGIIFSVVLNLYTLYSFEDLLKPIISTGRSSEPYTSFKRFLSTVAKLKSWFESDPWTKGTLAYSEMQTTRKLHNIVRRKMYNLSTVEFDEVTKMDRAMVEQRDLWLEDFGASCPAFKSEQCPHVPPELPESRLKGLNQGMMSLTMFGFVGLPILFPERFGIHDSTYEDLDAFVHLWRGLGYLLGVEDEFNFCRGTFEETKQRSVDFLKYFAIPKLRNITAEYEHMIRCAFEGLNFYVPGIFYDSGLLHLTDAIGLKMPRLKASLSYKSWISYNVLHLIMYKLCRFGWFKARGNRLIEASIDKALKFNCDKHTALQKRSNDIVVNVLRNIAKKKSEVTADSLNRALLVFLICTLILLLAKTVWLLNVFE